MSTRRRSWSGVAICVLLAAACASDGGGDPTGDEPSPSADAPASLPETSVDAGATSDTEPTATSDAADAPSEAADTGSDAAFDDDWANRPSALALAPDGDLYVATRVEIARRDSEGSWELIDVDALPSGPGVDSIPGRQFDHLAVAPDGTLWVVGTAISDVDDEAFGGAVDGWLGGRFVSWIAASDCGSPPCRWEVVTSNDEPALRAEIGGEHWALHPGALAFADDGSVYAPVGGPSMLHFDGIEWTAHPVPGFESAASPWSGSIAVTSDGVVWAGTNDLGPGLGLVSFDGTSFTHHTTGSGLPASNVFQVAVAPDGTLWAATDTLYGNLSTARPDAAEGVLHLDGTRWHRFTMEDGLLSNDAVVVTGGDDRVWALHYEIAPYGYSSYDDGVWTAHPVDEMPFGFDTVMGSDGTLWGIDHEHGEVISFDGTAVTTHATPFDDEQERFSFADDDLCEWISEAEVTRFVSTASSQSGLEWDGSVVAVEPVGSAWDLPGTDYCRWEPTGGGYVIARRLEPSQFGPVIGYSEWDQGTVLPAVSGHPGVPDGIIAASAAFGRYGFWPNGSDEALGLEVLLLEDGDTADSAVQERVLFDIAEGFLAAMGWTP